MRLNELYAGILLGGLFQDSWSSACLSSVGACSSLKFELRSTLRGICEWYTRWKSLYTHRPLDSWDTSH